MKKILAYLNYFFYLGFNWNFRLAFSIIYYEIKGEKKYGISTIGIDDLSHSVSEIDRKHASIYQPVNYFIAEWLFKKIDQLLPDKEKIRILDAGCGKGRAILMAAYYGFQKISGFDISPYMCHETINNIDKARSKYPGIEFTIEQANAAEYQIADDTCVIFLFNPFDKHIMQPFADHVMQSLDRVPRDMFILYANPECRKIWEDAGFKKLEEIKKLHWLHGMVLKKAAD